MITFLYGLNDYELKLELKRRVADFIARHNQTALERYDALELDTAKLPELLQNVSLFAPERLMLIEGADKNKLLWNNLADQLNFVPEATQLIITAVEPDKRTKTFKTLQKEAEVKLFAPLKNDAFRWLVDEVKARGSEISISLAHQLVERVGDDQFTLSNELDKLLSYGEISAKSIELLVEPTSQHTIFQLLDAVINSNTTAVKKLITELRNSEDPYMFFGLLAKQVHVLASLVAGTSEAETVKAFKAHPFVVQKLQPAAKKLTWREMQLVIESLASLDIEIKTSGHDPWTLVEKTALKISSR